MVALNFISHHNEELLRERQKTATIRLGDIRDMYPENSVVWVTYGPKYKPKQKLYPAFVDKTLVKRMADLTSDELNHQDPDVHTVEELIRAFETIYEKKIYVEDLVTVIHFSEIVEEK